MPVQHGDRAEIDIALGKRQQMIFVCRLEFAIHAMRPVVTGKHVDNAVGNKEADHIGNRKPFPPEKARPLVSAPAIHVGIGKGDKGDHDIAWLWQPAPRTLFGTLGLRLDDPLPREERRLDNAKPALRVVHRRIQLGNRIVDAFHGLRREDGRVVNALENPLDSLDVGLARLGAVLVEINLRLALFDRIDQLGRRCDQGLGLRRQVANGQEILGNVDKLCADLVEHGAARRHRKHRNLNLGRAPARLRECLRRRRQIARPGLELAGQICQLPLYIGEAALCFLRGELRIGQKRNQLPCLVDSGFKAPCLVGAEHAFRHRGCKRFQLRAVAHNQRRGFQIARADRKRRADRCQRFIDLGHLAQFVGSIREDRARRAPGIIKPHQHQRRDTADSPVPAAFGPLRIAEDLVARPKPRLLDTDPDGPDKGDQESDDRDQREHRAIVGKPLSHDP